MKTERSKNSRERTRDEPERDDDREDRHQHRHEPRDDRPEDEHEDDQRGRKAEGELARLEVLLRLLAEVVAGRVVAGDADREPAAVRVLDDLLDRPCAGVALDGDRDERRVPVGRDGDEPRAGAPRPSPAAPPASCLPEVAELGRSTVVGPRGRDDHVLLLVRDRLLGTRGRSRSWPSSTPGCRRPFPASSARAARSPRARARRGPRRPRSQASGADAPRTREPAARSRPCRRFYSTVTVLARFLGWSTLRPRSRAMR